MYLHILISFLTRTIQEKTEAGVGVGPAAQAPVLLGIGICWIAPCAASLRTLLCVCGDLQDLYPLAVSEPGLSE